MFFAPPEKRSFKTLDVSNFASVLKKLANLYHLLYTSFSNVNRTTDTKNDTFKNIDLYTNRKSEENWTHK